MNRPWVIHHRTLTDEAIAADLAALEATYGMTSAEFLRRYNGGELDDRPDHIRWSGLLAIAGKVGVFDSAMKFVMKKDANLFRRLADGDAAL